MDVETAFDLAVKMVDTMGLLLVVLSVEETVEVWVALMVQLLVVQ